MQVHDIDMAAANVDTNAIIETIENHVRPDMVGSGGTDQIQQIDLGDLLTGNGDGDLGDGATFNAGDLDQSALDALLSEGGGFDAQSVLGTVAFAPDLGVLGVPSAGAFAGTESAAGSAAAGAFAGIALALNGLPAAYQSLLSGIASAELAFNSALVEAQLGVLGQLDDGDAASEIAHFIFLANNSIVAQSQYALNSMLGIDLSGAALHDSLFGDFDASSAAFGADWDALLASFTPEVVSAVLHDNLALLLADLDIPSYLASFLLSLF
ncbi:hypothetical protein [Mycolicibacter senuensis]|nr:hypothetical protein [Mycolicibacter senuensis]MDQ2628634.1 hypothetical protein [Actinomycetota bacterium]ORW63674.1 hypothetical protein AWC24_01735 [Mycolicibacter senuensis]